MKKATSEPHIVETLSMRELCRFCQSDEGWVIELVGQGVLEPEGSTVTTWRFHGVSIARARRAQRLRRDLGINAAGAALVLELLEEREAMLRRLARLEQT